MTANSRNHKSLEETMKPSTTHTPNSSVESTATPDSSDDPSETRDSSFYFPGCRKDANCSCDICIASINATLDLMPPSTHRSTLTKFSASRPLISRSPVSFNPSMADVSAPRLRGRMGNAMMGSPPSSVSSESMDFEERVEKRKGGYGVGVFGVRVIWVLLLLFSVEYGVSWMVSGVLKARLSKDVVMGLGEKSREFEGMSERFVLLEKELEGLVGRDEVSRCSSVNSIWKISQDGLLLNTRCVLYESTSEEVSIWGWPLQAAGLLTAQHSPRSFTIISGRVTEWSNGEAKYLVRKASNSSWTQEKWSASVVQFDSNTWILEYKRSLLMNNPKLLSATMEFLKFRSTTKLTKMKKQFWLLSAFGSVDFDHAGGSISLPT